MGLEDALKEHIIGQDEAVHSVAPVSYTHLICPRDRAGFMMLAAFMAPSESPALLFIIQSLQSNKQLSVYDKSNLTLHISYFKNR